MSVEIYWNAGKIYEQAHDIKVVFFDCVHYAVEPAPILECGVPPFR